MKTITPENPKYDELVNIKSERNYVIDCTQITDEEEVVCPFDRDMKVSKTSNGAIVLKKKSFLHPFSLKPE